MKATLSVPKKQYKQALACLEGLVRCLGLYIQAQSYGDAVVILSAPLSGRGNSEDQMRKKETGLTPAQQKQVSQAMKSKGYSISFS